MKKKINIFLFLGIISIFAPSLCWAVADPVVNGAAVNPSPIVAPTGIAVSFNTANNGTSTSSAAVKITVSLSLLKPSATFNPLTDISGGGASRFTWVYDPSTNVVTGTLNSVWAPASGGAVIISNLVSTGLSSPGSEANGLNVNVVAPGAVNSSTTNDNTSAYTSSSTVLPIKLTTFTVQKEGAQANLTWATTEEVNSDHFEIQHSLDTKSWVGIGQVASNRESNVRQSYTFTHPNPASGSNYYRLKMVDQDATFAYSRIESAEFEGTRITVYPNPVADVVFLKGVDASLVNEVSLINTSGVVVQKTAGLPTSGINVKSLVNGIYLIQIQEKNGNRSTQKVVISK
ncbi:T9SS type A sorting domain-containing protein [Dyadobacter sp. CY312]|uniref:T9SS type A sorting domain-containing protein n=1 Tax=Dyadobacter sp. CY312 TaxID=2907303 RepID=UPI001F34F2A6|nr:T9SS type A sorting domain-containing protein [Dyadobacter sp. CY312]MCE7044635.1 T9SS type A sorting domain-containing protein [Dyadobacter sp. CY312]